MTVVHQGICPLCSIAAEYVERDVKKRHHFYCKQCKEFVITDTAKRKLLGGNEGCTELSKLSASLSEDEILHIYFEEREIKKRVEFKSVWRNL
jgi:hypothetical protein